MQFLQQVFYENMQKSQANYMEEVKQIKAKQEKMWNNTNRFQSQIRKEQEMLAREIQKVRKSQINQTLMNNKRAETEKNLQQAVERQGKDIAEMRKQLNLWTRNTSAREAYTCWDHQQANLNLRKMDKRKLEEQETEFCSISGQSPVPKAWNSTPRRPSQDLRPNNPCLSVEANA
ncbi:hypothetical protein PIB30_084998 [Stylosanthes scabra]|uniref:Uncharacterized protein n=1 Tax=Stylosanthes scabra TaxID=79078 RepID=A0ABU6WUG2_9FABA|nr:hypothetical protein [Stylosanthes scabra]